MKHKISTVSRRNFLNKAILAAGAPYFVPATVLGKGARPAPSNRLTLGLIGLGSMGMRHLKGFIQEEDCQIIGVCDVDASRRSEAVREINAHYGNRDCADYNNFRDLIAREDLDTVCIAVPDHWHAIPSLLAIRSGKDVYGEKPLTLTIDEGKEIVRAVRRYGCVWQTGSWQRSTAHFRFGCELVRNGRIGKLECVEVGIKDGPSTECHPVMPVPEGFDYDRWLGPAPLAPYTEMRCHWNFRWILDYSGGQFTDAGAHDVDIAQWGMGTDKTGPVEVEGKGIFPPDGLWDAAVEYHVKCRYAEGPPLFAGSAKHYKQGIRFIGDAGWVHLSRKGIEVHDQRLLREKFGPEEIHLYRPSGDNREGHRRNFLDCVKTRADAITPAETGHRSATILHLANISMLLGRKVHWDPGREEIVADPTAARMMRRGYRSPYHL